MNDPTSMWSGPMRCVADPNDFPPWIDDGVRPDSLDRRAHRHEEVREVLDVRFAGGVAQDRRSFGGNGGHQRVLGAGHRRFVEEHVGSAEARRAELIAIRERVLGAELLEGEEVSVHAPPTDDVSAGRGQDDLSASREHRPGQQDGRANLRAKGWIQLAGAKVLRLDLERVVAGPVCRCANRTDEFDHCLGVQDPRDVLELNSLAGQQRGGNNRKGGVLVPGGLNRTGQGWPPSTTYLMEDIFGDSGALSMGSRGSYLQVIA